MRDNGPVTQREVEFPDNVKLVSRTDPGGRITFVNAAFIAISGFSEEELTGAPHNIVRHPDMPKEAFADMWGYLKAGNPWRGLVKNRTKTGDHYWVRADVMPVIENGKLAGYVSVRSKPSRADVAAAETAYKAIREGNPEGLIVDCGQVKRRPPVWDRVWRSVGGMLSLQIAITVAAFLAIAGVGLGALYFADKSLETIYLDRVIPAAQLSDIDSRMRDNLDNLVRVEGALAAGRDTGIKGVIDALAANRDAINKIWAEYLSSYLTPEEADLAKTFEAQRNLYVTEGLAPGLKLAEAGDTIGLANHIDAKARPLLLDAAATNFKLISLQRQVAKEEYDNAKHNFEISLMLSGVLLLLGIVGTGLAAKRVRRIVVLPMGRMSAHFSAIARRDDNHVINEEPTKEFVQPGRMLRAMQGLLGYAEQEKIEIDRRSTARAKTDLHALADTLESRVHSIVADVGRASTLLADSAQVLSTNADITRQRSQAVQDQAEEVRRNVDSVAAATHELAAAETEISRQVANTAKISRTAEQQAQSTRATVANLSRSADRIGEIVQLITEVAGKTNMLALNATIEATRAGDAGKGFAVVAGEVKALAQQTGHATEEISSQITAIQGETGKTVSAINGITKTISEVSQVSSAVAAAVEEQGAATQEIARSVNEVALGTQRASENVAVVANIARETETMASEVLSSANTLREAAQMLDHEVSDFLVGIRR
jgi:aerotaxis receptor